MNSNTINQPSNIVNCNKCNKNIRLHPSQSSLYPKQTSNVNNSTSAIPTAIQCGCHANHTFECMECCDLYYCRSCGMYYCKKCRMQMKVLQCAYCPSFVCSKHCYHTLFSTFFHSIENVCGIPVKSHESVYKLHKMIMKPNLYSQWKEFQLQSSEIPFVICINCRKNNCGCMDWMACADCRRYYCYDCQSQKLVKCALDECQSHTCCQSHVWNGNCEYCDRKQGGCGLIFCTNGHCNSHLISEEVNHRVKGMVEHLQKENQIEVDVNMAINENSNI